MSLDPFNATWTKVLHGEPEPSPPHAIESLLKESGKELTKLFLANGSIVPFEGDTAQTLTLCREERRNSSAGSSSRSEFVFIATPGSSLPDIVPEEPVNDEALVEEAAIEEAPVEEIATDPAPDPVDEAPIEEIAVKPADDDAVAEESMPVLGDPPPIQEQPAPICEDSEPVPQEPVAVNFDWGYSFPSKKDKKMKKKKARFVFDESYPPVEETLQEDVYPAISIDEETQTLQPESNVLYLRDEPPPQDVYSF